VAAIPDTFLLRGIRLPVLPQLELESVTTIPDTLFLHWLRLPKPSRSRSWNLWPPYPTPIICKGFVSKIPSAIGVGNRRPPYPALSCAVDSSARALPQ
jgi:hypothetical protein